MPRQPNNPLNFGAYSVCIIISAEIFETASSRVFPLSRQCVNMRIFCLDSCPRYLVTHQCQDLPGLCVVSPRLDRSPWHLMLPVLFMATARGVTGNVADSSRARSSLRPMPGCNRSRIIRRPAPPPRLPRPRAVPTPLRSPRGGAASPRGAGESAGRGQKSPDPTRLPSSRLRFH